MSVGFLEDVHHCHLVIGLLLTRLGNEVTLRQEEIADLANNYELVELHGNSFLTLINRRISKSN